MAHCGIYVHIPFCAQKCPYCDFYSVAYDEAFARQYVEALIRQLETFPPCDVDTLYFGGGTPSLLGAADIAAIIDAAARHMRVQPGSEITLELNPETADLNKLRAFKQAGVNRLSVGVQTTHPDTLRAIGRRHTAGQAVDTILLAHEAGFENISADMMLGLPAQTARQAEQTIAALSALPVRHVSAYLLKLMDNTPFGKNPPASIPGDDTQAELYELACAMLERFGLRQYEISNFAQPGYESRHNLKYWNCDAYIGLGAAAHTSLHKKRYRFAPDARAFVQTYACAPTPVYATDLLEYDGDVTAQDYIMLRLRTTAGLLYFDLYKMYNFRLDKQTVAILRRYAENGFARISGEGVSLTRRGMLVSNTILASIL